MAENTPSMTLTGNGLKTCSPGSFGRKECKGKTRIRSHFKKYLKLRLLSFFAEIKYEALAKMFS